MKNLAASLAFFLTAAAYGATDASFGAFDAKARAGERLTIAFFGGSLTWGANASDPNLTGFRGLMADFLESKYPAAHFKFVDAAIGGTGSELAIFRLERDVLSHRPDLVFLDFMCNDGPRNPALEPSCCYEHLLRRIIGEGVPVVQMFFTFRDFALAPPPPRHDAYMRLASEYSTGVGDVYATGLVPALASGKITIKDVWPLDGGHPCDLGYSLFAEAGMAAVNRAVEEKLVCRIPKTPVFGTVSNVRRLDACELHDGAWHNALAYRTSLWFDALPSRWLDGVLEFSGHDRSPLEIRAEGNLFGIFGDADENALSAGIFCDGMKIATFDARHRAGNGKLFFWRRVFCDGGSHVFSIDPLPRDGGAFRIGAVCTATVAPRTPRAVASSDHDEAIETIDHSRGVTAE